MTTPLLLIASTFLTQTAIEIPPTQDDLVPQPPRFVDGLSKAIVESDRVCLLQDRADAVSEMLGYCSTGYPKACAAALEAKAEIVAADWRLKVIEAEQESATRIPVWEAVLLAASAVIVAGGVGLITGRLL